MQIHSPYTERFFQDQHPGSRRSAEQVVPFIIELIRPTSVIDIGCGLGTWLSVFHRHGIEDICGIDGSYIDTTALQIQSDRFVSMDLSQPLTHPRRFDLAVSLEVAEHLPELVAAQFIEGLTKLSDIVVFSAAIPHQGGTHHVNEQWPEYWCDLFSKRGFVVADCLRYRIWNNTEVDPWYAQNMLIYVKRSALERYPVLAAAAARTNLQHLAMVHPKLYLAKAERLQEYELWDAAVRELESVIPVNSAYLLVQKQDSRCTQPLPGRTALPFMERSGEYWGKPENDAEAIREIERMRTLNVEYMAFPWAAFWWLEYYSGMRDYLYANFNCVLENGCIIVFDLVAHRAICNR